MQKIIAFLGGWKGYVAAGLLAGAVAAGGAWWLCSVIKDKEIADLKLIDSNKDRDAYKAGLEAFQKAAQQIADAAAKYGDDRKRLNEEFAKIERGLRDAMAQNPLPVGCKPDAARMRVNSDAVAAANKAASGR